MTYSNNGIVLYKDPFKTLDFKSHTFLCSYFPNLTYFLSFASTWIHILVFGRVRVAHLFNFLC